ncbi:myxosortase-dependent M36 family metallopeptidase [Pyxidicoccus sp. QH1ED-7-1]|nr:myxosortase-dependent M36 family metallopeptidase [Pyxidicoccus xibeiensis]
MLSGTSAVARTLPNYDANLDAKPAGRASAGFKSVNAVKGARVAHRDSLTDTPTFVWAKKTQDNAKLRAQVASMPPDQAALSQLAAHAPLYGVSSFEAAGAKVVSVSQNRQGVKVVKLAQESGGIEVFRQSLNVLLNRDNEVVAISGNFSRHVTPETVTVERARFKVSAASAVSKAYQDLTGTTLDASLLRPLNANAKKAGPGEYTHYELATYARPLAEGLLIPARVRAVYYPMPNTLVPAYYVELNTGTADSKDSDYYSFVVSALDGSLLMRNNLTAHADFSYRVYAETTPPYTPHDGPGGTTASPHPTGNPDGYRAPYIAPALITLQNVPFSQNDPWLPDGATVTTGNNVDAYADLVAPDNYNPGDLRPTVTAPGVFDRTLLFDIEPNANPEQIAAATTSLFYMNNWLHDWFYDAGFDERSGNAQTDNFNRGGLGNDAIRAQAQDYTGIDNANMQTPSDGASPRMQMYRFTGPRNSRLTVNAPAAIAGNYRAGVTTVASLGPALFDVTGDAVAAIDPAEPPPAGSTVPGTTLDGCSPFTNAAEVTGKIAIVDRGFCSFNFKIENAQAAGAIGVIIVDNANGFLQDVGGASTATITIPTLRLTLADGTSLRNNLTGLNVRLWRGPTTGLDGTVDNAIVAHEWGHYISNRLIGNANGLINNQGRAMGEGWGDFTALLMMVRAEDINVPSNANWSGVYAMAEYATRGSSPDSSFFGIRRGAYSVDPTKNALRFRHIMDGVPLPTTTPFAPAGVNSQVHNSGEVWASMLWEGYVALLRAHPFQEAQDRMKSYVVNGYKMTPVSPTYTEARDGVLAAAFANDPADHLRLWAAFARRGMGVGAIAPVRTSVNHAGLVESYGLGADVELVSARYADSAATPGDADGILDNGETGTIVVTIANRGAEPARATSITVFSPTPGVTVGNRGSVNAPEIPVSGSVDVAVPVSLRGATQAQRLDFFLATRDDGQSVPGDKSGELSFKANYDELPEATATETVEASEANLPWDIESDETLTPDEWTVVELDATLNRAYYGPNLGSPSDLRLITPALNVSATVPFSITFSHAHDFEWDSAANYDGAVIELSEDGGENWVDVGESLYNGEITTGDGVINPLQGRRAFTGTTPGFPALIPTTLNLGTAYAGKTVQVRFRIGSDNFVAATGWVLDNISFSGITNTPFTKICADTGTCVNSAPVISAGPDVTVDERAQVSLTGTAYDVDGQALQYLWASVSNPAVTITGANTLNPTFTAPNVTADTNLVLRLSTTDGVVVVTDTVTVRILNVNRAPTVNAGVNGVADERSSFTLSGSASDADSDTLTYSWTQVSGTRVGINNPTSATATFSTPEVSAAGETLTFQLAVSDGRITTTDTVDVNINNVNRAPAVTASSVTADERSTITLSATGSDPDGDTVSYAWMQVGEPAVVLTGADTATPSFSAGDIAADTVLTFRVTVSDGTATTSQDVVVNVRNINRAPTVNAGVDGAVAERAAATLSGSASDADSDTLSYAWTQVSGTPVALSGATSLTATFTAPETANGETLTFRLTVSDGQATNSDEVSVQVSNENRGPAVTASAVTVDERTTATLTASGTDPDGDTVSYTWTQVGGEPTVTLTGADTATASFTAPEVTANTELTFRVTVSDGAASASSDVTVTVRQVNRAPVANAGADAAVAARATATLNGSASTDADGQTLTFQWTQVGGPWVTLTGADTASATFTAPKVKENTDLTFRLVVSDGELTSNADTVTITVTKANQAPVAKARIILSGDQTSMTLDGSGSTDPDEEGLTYKWEQTTGPAVQLGNANQAVLSVDVPELDDDSASFSFKLTVTDASGATHSATVEATATPDGGGGCSSTGAGAPAGMLGLALLSLLRRRRQQN